MSISIHQCRIDDLPKIQNANLNCLPENYAMKYYTYHFLNWPELSFVAEDHRGRIIGYVLAKMEEEIESVEDTHGHITSLAVMRSYRKLGLATKLMLKTERVMVETFDARYVSLHVRATNRAARKLYEHTLGFKVHDIEKGYYADGEDGYALRKDLSHVINQLKEEYVPISLHDEEPSPATP